jgi:hypothetical protein
MISSPPLVAVVEGTGVAAGADSAGAAPAGLGGCCGETGAEGFVGGLVAGCSAVETRSALLVGAVLQ